MAMMMPKNLLTSGNPRSRTFDEVHYPLRQSKLPEVEMLPIFHAVHLIQTIQISVYSKNEDDPEY